MYEILINSTRVVRSEAGQSIFDACKNGGVNLPHSCLNGQCSSCRVRVRSGKTKSLAIEIGLSELEKKEDWVLSCVRSADTDLDIAVEEIIDLVLPEPKIFPCKISQITHLSDDVLNIEFRLPPNSGFKFLPGQYIKIIGPNGVRRSYSLASSSHDTDSFCIILKNVTNGVMSDYWFNRAKVGDLLRFHGPFGTFCIREANSIDLTFLATGAGIAPFVSILGSDFPSKEVIRSVTLYWGVRSQEDFFLDIPKLFPDITFIPVVSRGAEHWSGARGYVQEIASQDVSDMSNLSIYACGSQDMVRDAKDLFLKMGLLPSAYFSDAFVSTS